TYCHTHTLAYLCSCLTYHAYFLFLMIRPPPCFTLFPYTTLFRSCPSRFGLRRTREAAGVWPALPEHRVYRHDIRVGIRDAQVARSEEHTSELQSRGHLVCRLLLEKKNICDDVIYQDVEYLGYQRA